MRVAVAALVVGACYQPSVATGVPCTSTRDCPAGQTCNSNDRCDVPGRDAAIDAPVIPIDAFALLGWAPPQKLAELNTMEYETDPSISADGLDIVFASTRAGGVGSTDLYRASRQSRDQPFSTPVRIAELSTPLADQAAELSADALTLYLKIPTSTMTQDIASARRMTRTSPFGSLTPEPSLSSPEDDTNPAISRDGRTFSTTRGMGSTRELYIYERQNQNQPWSPARQVMELSTPMTESGAAFGADGLVVIFQSDRDSPMADVCDLYVASRSATTEPFRDVMPLAELNTAGNESDATITADLRYIVFECAQDLCYSTR
ncbi:MAG TPA: hypothetical protein VFO79_09120 [Xanthomonadales bacterium]|nr:hypothetical protein [Xanthomonadales bacterium]